MRKFLLLILVPLVLLTGCNVDDSEYLGSGSVSENPININLHSNTVGYYLYNYDVKDVGMTDGDILYDYDTSVANPTVTFSTVKTAVANNISTIAKTLSSGAEALAERITISGVKWSTKGTPTPRYYQSKQSWSSYTYYAKNKTISSSGCGACALAMAVTALTGETVTPKDIVKFLNSKDINTVYNGETCVKAVCKKYNLNYKSISRSNKTTIDSWLDKGGLIIMTINANGIYTGGGHYIMCTGRDSDGYYVMESGSYYKTDKAYKFNQVFTSGNQGPFVIYK